MPSGRVDSALISLAKKLLCFGTCLRFERQYRLKLRCTHSSEPSAFLAPTQRIVAPLKQRHPSTPIIGFPRGSGVLEAPLAFEPVPVRPSPVQVPILCRSVMPINAVGNAGASSYEVHCVVVACCPCLQLSDSCHLRRLSRANELRDGMAFGNRPPHLPPHEPEAEPLLA